MSNFVKNCWYVAAWSYELGSTAPIGREIIGQPVVLGRRPDGSPFALENRCAHRRAPLSLGRIEGCAIRCMYHGMVFDTEGKGLSVPGADRLPPNASVKRYPVVEQDSWLWVWMGNPDLADAALIPKAFGLDDPQLIMRADQIDYDAHYELINDNLCDLSHLDFVHETTLGLATGGGWSDEQPRVLPQDRGIRIERWNIGKPASPTNPKLVDNWSTYDYHVPGVFVMENKSFAHGTAQAGNYAPPLGMPMTYRIEQQAVTPLSETRTRYFFATGFDAKIPAKVLDGIFTTVMAAFAEDRAIIEAQQRIWNLTDSDRPMAFLPQDKAPAMMRRILARLIKAEQKPLPDKHDIAADQ